MIGIHIYGVESRLDNMLENAAKLPGAHIHIDDRYGQDHGCYPSLYTCRKAFLAPQEEGETHRLVLQDDVELCDGFFEILQRTWTLRQKWCIVQLRIEVDLDGGDYFILTAELRR